MVGFSGILVGIALARDFKSLTCRDWMLIVFNFTLGMGCGVGLCLHFDNGTSSSK